MEWDLQHNAASAKSSGFHDPGRKPVRGVGAKPTVGFGSGAPRMSRVDSGLHKTQSLSDAVPAAGRGKKVIRAKPAPKVRAEEQRRRDLCVGGFCFLYRKLSKKKFRY